MKKISFKTIFSIIILVVILTTAFFLKDNIYNFVYKFIKYPSDFNNLVNEFDKKIFLPDPLRIETGIKGTTLTKEGIISETNKYRVENGLESLGENSKLSSAALKKAEDMFKNQYFDHVSPSGVGPDQVVLSSGYNYIITGENLLLGNFKSDEDAVEAWIGSPPHRENMLTERYTDIGVAVLNGTFEGQNVWIAVQEFGLPLSACPEPDIYLKQRIDLYQMELDNLSSLMENKKKEIDNFKGENNKEYTALIDEYNNLVEDYNHKSKLIKEAVNDYNNQVDAFNSCLDL